MKIHLLNIILITSFLVSDPSEYIWPTDASKTLTAFFGEMRPHRYHTGIDIRTYGKNGDNVYAITDGYIYRIKVSNEGYGNVIYIKHDDDNISLYAHLSKFSPKIQKAIEQLQFKRNSYEIDHLLEPGLINVSKGDVIGYTGDTGGLSGPHLHFEIRDEINRPINPLNTSLGKVFYDTKKPEPMSIAFIPQSINSKINGFGDIQEYKLSKHSTTLKDTVKVKGDFGIALKVVDRVNSQPFKYGIYSIDLFIDGEYHYGVKFDRTSFSQTNQIYLERNYELFVCENAEYYQLFKVDFQNNSFINKKSQGSIIKENGLHEFKIIIKDIDKNETQLTGNFTYNQLIIPDYNTLELSDGSWMIEYSNIKEIDDLECTISNYEISTSNSIPCNSSYNGNKVTIHNSNKTYNTAEIKLRTRIGETIKHYILLDEKLSEIKGDFLVNHNYNNISLNFIEHNFSGLSPSLIYERGGTIYKDSLTRIDKNILSTELLSIDEFSTMENISIEYDIDNYSLLKESDIEKAMVYPENFSDIKFRDGQISITHNKNTFFENSMIYTHNVSIDNNQSIIQPFQIGPNAIPFNKPLTLSINLFNKDNIDNSNICFYKNGKWYPLKTIRDNTKTIKADIKSGGIVGVLLDNSKPEVQRIVPRNKATYKIDDIKEFEIYLKDDFSGVDHKDGITLNINGKEVLTGFNIYQKKLVALRVEDYLKIGKNNYSLIVYDNSNNKRKIESHFYIKE